jgi:muramoyltetrapeptide carboxypeptidase
MIAPDRIRLNGPSAPFVLPPALKPGGTIGVAALSGRVDPARLDRGLAYLRSRGYRVVEAANLRHAHGDFAGTDGERAAGYRALIENSPVDAIFFARGGWGAARVLPFLDFGAIAARPLIHMGGSDLTTLFASLQAHARLACFHGPMVAADFAAVPRDPETESSWEPVLRGEAPLDLSLTSGQVVAAGIADAPIVGGCLSMLAALEGTAEAIDTDGKILFWEDVHEEVYRLDRMLVQLERAGRFAAPAGVIIGALENIVHHGRPDPEAVTALIQERFSNAPYPVVRDWPSGHGRRNRTLPLGVPAAIDTARLVVRFPGPAVA